MQCDWYRESDGFKLLHGSSSYANLHIKKERKKVSGLLIRGR